MASLNKITIIGHLGKDPELRTLESGKTVTSFSVAVSHKYKEQEETLWFEISAFGKLGELANQYLAKGRSAYVEGRLSVDTWQDRNSGENRFKLKIIASDIRFLDSRAEVEAQARNQPVPQHDEALDEIPW